MCGKRWNFREKRRNFCGERVEFLQEKPQVLPEFPWETAEFLWEKAGFPWEKAGFLWGKGGMSAGKARISMGKGGIPTGKAGIPMEEAGIPIGKAQILTFVPNFLSSSQIFPIFPFSFPCRSPPVLPTIPRAGNSGIFPSSGNAQDDKSHLNPIIYPQFPPLSFSHPFRFPRDSKG